MPIRLLLAVEQALSREGLRCLLSRERGFDIIGVAADGRKAVTFTNRLRPDVLLLELPLPQLSGPIVTTRVLAKRSTLHVLTLAGLMRHRDVIAMLNAGALGYVLRTCTSKQLMQAVRTVNAGRNYLSPEVERFVIDDYKGRLNLDGKADVAVLTEREREVLQAIAEGSSTKLIAGALHVSVKTIETHRQHITKKLRLHGIAELTKYAVREGLASL